MSSFSEEKRRWIKHCHSSTQSIDDWFYFSPNRLKINQLQLAYASYIFICIFIIIKTRNGRLAYVQTCSPRPSVVVEWPKCLICRTRRVRGHGQRRTACSVRRGCVGHDGHGQAMVVHGPWAWDAAPGLQAGKAPRLLDAACRCGGVHVLLS